MYFFKLGWLAPLVSTTVSALSFREIQLKNELRMLEEAFKPTPASNARGRIHAEPEIYGFNITVSILPKPSYQEEQLVDILSKAPSGSLWQKQGDVQEQILGG